MMLHTIIGEKQIPWKPTEYHSASTLLLCPHFYQWPPHTTAGFLGWLILYMRQNTFDFRHLERTLLTVTIYAFILCEMTMRELEMGQQKVKTKYSVCFYPLKLKTTIVTHPYLPITWRHPGAGSTLDHDESNMPWDSENWGQKGGESNFQLQMLRCGWYVTSHSNEKSSLYAES